LIPFWAVYINHYIGDIKMATQFLINRLTKFDETSHELSLGCHLPNNIDGWERPYFYVSRTVYALKRGLHCDRSCNTLITKPFEDLFFLVVDVCMAYQSTLWYLNMSFIGWQFIKNIIYYICWSQKCVSNAFTNSTDTFKF